MVDVLVIGSGGAGLSAALSAKEAGASVLVAGKSYPTTSQTSMAQGGMNAALGNTQDDSVILHIEDTLKSAHGLASEVMVHKMCEYAPKAIALLERLGVPFSRLNGKESAISSVAQRKLGGTSAARACYAQDYTGLKILHTLYDTCLKEGIGFYDEHYLLNLIVEEGVVKGATFYSQRAGDVVQVNAKSVVLATGGFGALYEGHTTNAFGSTGDGLAAVLKAGGKVSDMEFIQFHPTGFKNSSLLLSEAARGEGGTLVNSKGERFVDELKPRDEVARAIFEQLQKGEEVYIDVRHLGKEKLMELLPQELELCRLHEGIDLVHELASVKPVAHYTMGGIEVDENLEVEAIQGCFAVGECSNAKVHGANRLGGNSLLEIVAFGKLAGENAKQFASGVKSTMVASKQLENDKTQLEKIFASEPTENFYEVKTKLAALLYDKVGIVRNNESLQEALEEVVSMQEGLQEMGTNDKSRENNQNLQEFLEFQNALLLSYILINAALTRDESRGAHYKVGFEQKNETFNKHISIGLDEVLV